MGASPPLPYFAPYGMLEAVALFLLRMPHGLVDSVDTNANKNVLLVFSDGTVMVGTHSCNKWPKNAQNKSMWTRFCAFGLAQSSANWELSRPSLCYNEKKVKKAVPR